MRGFGQIIAQVQLTDTTSWAVNPSVVYVGDSFTLSITGSAANSPVAVNGTAMGTTDGDGNWSTSGTWESGVVGPWNESWSVGGETVGQVNFQVQAAPAAPPAVQNTLAPPVMPVLLASACSASQTYIPPGGQFTSGPNAGRTTPTGACQDNAAGTGTSATSFFSETIFGIPTWLLLAGAVGILFIWGHDG